MLLLNLKSCVSDSKIFSVASVFVSSQIPPLSFFTFTADLTSHEPSTHINPATMRMTRMQPLTALFLLFTTVVVHAQNANLDQFNYRETDLTVSRDYGPREWINVRCGNLDTCVSCLHSFYVIKDTTCRFVLVSGSHCLLSRPVRAHPRRQALRWRVVKSITFSPSVDKMPVWTIRYERVGRWIGRCVVLSLVLPTHIHSFTHFLLLLHRWRQ